MIKKELKSNFKSFLIWLLILVMMFLLVFSIYPFIITDETIGQMDELLKVFPKEILKAFNMDMASIETAYGWFKTEGFMFVLLIIGFYSSYLGGTIVLKEENDKTIEYLAFLPIKRKRIMLNKVIVGLIYIVSIVLLLGLFNFIALLITGDFNKKEFILLSMSPLLIALPLFSINLFISMFLHKTKKVVGISLGLVFMFYLLNVLSEISSKVEFLKYLSIYTLADTRGVITNTTINFWCILISILLSISLIISSFIVYDKKELI